MLGLLWLTCACEGAALGGSGRVAPLRRSLQQVVQAAEAARQVAQQALLARAVPGRWPAAAAHVGRRVGRRVAAGVAQRLVGMRTLGVTNKQSAGRGYDGRRGVLSP